MSDCRRMLLHAHITPSTLSQLLHYFKVRLLMSQSIQWHWQLTLAEVSWAWGGCIAQYMLTIWWRLDTAIHDWGYYFLHDQNEPGLQRAGQLAQLFLELLCKTELSLLSYSELACSSCWNEQDCLKACIIMVYLLTCRSFIFTKEVCLWWDTARKPCKRNFISDMTYGMWLSHSGFLGLIFLPSNK